MQKKHRNGRASTKTSIEDEIAHLRGPTSRGFDQDGRVYSGEPHLLI